MSERAVTKSKSEGIEGSRVCTLQRSMILCFKCLYGMIIQIAFPLYPPLKQIYPVFTTDIKTQFSKICPNSYLSAQYST